MRIGTWNLAGRWDPRHLALIESMDCDVLLLTEVSERVELPGYNLHLGGLLMMPKRRWAAVASRLPMRPLSDPHGATAVADVDGLRMCSSILPWKGCGAQEPWVGATPRRGPSPQLPRLSLRPPWSGAATGTTPSQAGSGRRRGLGPEVRARVRRAAGTPRAHRPFATPDRRSPQHRPHRRPQGLGRQRHSTASSMRRREPDLRPRRLRGRSCQHQRR